MPFDPVTVSAVALSDVLRAWLRARRESPEAQASAMAYESAALIALHAPDVPRACQLVDEWAADMKEQIQQFGVGVEHP
jgi:hypothetical protein